MRRYTIELNNFISILRANIQKAVRRYPEIDARLRWAVRDIPHGVLSETVVRLFWNDFNISSRFPHEKWDDGAAIAEWFMEYNVEKVDVTHDGEYVTADQESNLLFEEVIDPTICFIHDRIFDQGFKRDWHWEEHRVIEVRGAFLLMEDMGDYRVRDWLRLKQEYESGDLERHHDIYRIYPTHTH